MVAEPKARDPTEGRGGPVAFVHWVVTLGGLAVFLVTGYLILRGPFFDGPALPPVQLFVALGGFLAGIIAFSWGGARTFDVGTRM
jgi:hypothetical protein